MPTVAGDPGIGKTRLLRELRERAEAQGHLVLSGAAAEFERDLPYSVWVDALDAYVGAHELRLGPDLDAELASLLPSVQAAGDRPTVADDRYRAHRAVKALLEALAAEHRLVLVLDDLHWSDDASLELIGALLRRGLDRPVLLALAYRPGQAPQRLLAALSGADVNQLRLAPLSEAESATLLGEAAGGAARPRRCTATAAATRSTSSSSSAPGRRPRGRRRRERQRDPARGHRRARRGAGGARARLAAADRRRGDRGRAVRARPRAAVAQLDADAALDALDDLLERDLVRPTDVPRWFSFRHPLVRRTVYETTRAGWRIAAHARAAAELGRRGAPAADRARHIEQCAAPGDEEAIALLIAAGEHAAPRAPATAARWFEAALRLLTATTTSARSTSASRSPRRCAPPASSTAAARCCSRPLTSSPPAPTPAASSSSRCAPRWSTGSATTRRRTTG